ncbi:MAG: tetratricopeptide repeat protein, partial [Acidobacteriota bacterium]
MTIAKAGFAQIANRSQRAAGHVGRLRSVNLMQFDYKTKQISYSLFLLCLVFISSTFAQSLDARRKIERAQLAFDNGNYSTAIENAKVAVETANGSNADALIFHGYDVIASSQISLQEYGDAETTLNKVLQTFSDRLVTPVEKAQIYLRFAWLNRSQHKFAEALDYSKKALNVAPENRHILAEHYLNLGRILFASGYDISAIIWLEKAESLLESENLSPAKLDTYRFLTLAWWAKLNYQKALKYVEKSTSAAKKTALTYKYRQAL